MYQFTYCIKQLPSGRYFEVKTTMIIG